MVVNWQKFTLKEICNLITDGKHGDCTNEEGSGYFFLSVKDVLDNRLVYDNARQITKEDFLETHRRTNLEEGDVLFTNTGTIGRMAIASNDPKTQRTTFQKSVAILKPKRDIVMPHFLYYMLKFNNKRLSSFAEGTTQKNLLLKDFRIFDVIIPPISEQRVITNILRTFDKKIELNQRMNQTLEGIGRAIFKHWFMDFEFPDEQGRPYKSSGGEMVDSELGEIPKGWDVGTLNDLCKLNANSWKTNNIPQEIHYVDLANAKNGNIEEIQLFNAKSAPSRAKRILSQGDTIFGTVRPANRSFALVGDHNLQLTGSTGFAVLSPKNSELREIVYLITTSDQNVERLTCLADGAAYPAVNPSVVVDEICVLPPQNIIENFHDEVGPLFDKVLLNKNNESILSQIRDSLLPQLISGKIRLMGN